MFNFVNNIVYNWYTARPTAASILRCSNFINNYYKPGPATPRDTPVGHRIIEELEARRVTVAVSRYGRVYAVGNVMEGYPEVTADNWKGGIQVGDQFDTIPAEVLAMMRSREPFAMPPLTILPSEQTFDHVQHVGATMPRRDIVDERIVEEVRTGQPYVVKKLGKKNPYGNVWGPSEKSQELDGLFKYRRLGKDSYKLGIITDPGQMEATPTTLKASPTPTATMTAVPGCSGTGQRP